MCLPSGRAAWPRRPARDQAPVATAEHPASAVSRTHGRRHGAPGPATPPSQTAAGRRHQTETVSTRGSCPEPPCSMSPRYVVAEAVPVDGRTGLNSSATRRRHPHPASHHHLRAPPLTWGLVRVVAPRAGSDFFGCGGQARCRGADGWAGSRRLTAIRTTGSRAALRRDHHQTSHKHRDRRGAVHLPKRRQIARAEHSTQTWRPEPRAACPRVSRSSGGDARAGSSGR